MKARIFSSAKGVLERKLKERSMGRGIELQCRWPQTHQVTGSRVETRLDHDKPTRDELHLMSNAARIEYSHRRYRKPRRSLVRAAQQPLVQPPPVNAVCSLLFMHEQQKDDRGVRTQSLIDESNWQAFGTETDFPLVSDSVIRALEQIIASRGKPIAMLCDNGREYHSKRFVQWLASEEIALHYVPPGKPRLSENMGCIDQMLGTSASKA